MPIWLSGERSANPASIIRKSTTFGQGRKQASKPWPGRKALVDQPGRPGGEAPSLADARWLPQRGGCGVRTWLPSVLQRGNQGKQLFQALHEHRPDAERSGQPRRPALPALCPLVRPHSTDVSAEQAGLTGAHWAGHNLYRNGGLRVRPHGVDGKLAGGGGGDP